MRMFERIGLIALIAGLGTLPSLPAASQSLFFGGGSARADTHFYSYAPAVNYAPDLKPARAKKTLSAEEKLYRRGYRAFADKDYDQARKHWKKASKAGHVMATWRLGNIYRQGLGVKTSHVRAFKYYKLVARAHEDTGVYTLRTTVTVDAIVRLGHYYRAGIRKSSVKPRPKRAFALYQLAATHYGHSGAQYALGGMYIKGHGGKKSTARGMRWYVLAARKHHTLAQTALGDIYWDGKLVKRDRAEALKWYLLARKSADAGANPDFVRRVDDIYKQIDDADKARVDRSVNAWLRRYPSRRR
jgi:TPR repeat protein